MKLTVCICDDDKLIRGSFRTLLESDYTVIEVDEPALALKRVQTQTIDILLLDIQIKGKNDGLDFLPRIVQESPETWVIMISGLSDFRIIADAMKKGARDYWVKGAGEIDELAHIIRRSAETFQLERFKNRQLHQQQRLAHRHEWVGKSDALQTLRRTVDKIKSSRVNVLITGETGTGKEVVARHLHGEPTQPFVAVDSATIQSSTAESQLFGYEKGAFTGADRVQKGLFEEANGGIIYFDELANMPLEIQNKLLRVIQEKEICRMGSSRPIALDFRVVSATNQDLHAFVRDGKFKADLLQRLEVIPLQVPPLRERLEDLKELLEHFSKQESRPLEWDESVLDLLKRYPWPGNIRELKNLVSFAALMADSNVIAIADLPPKYRTGLIQSSHDQATSEKRTFYSEVGNFEKNFLKTAYRDFEANISKMAIALDMDRSHLYAKLKQYEIHSPGKKS